MFVIHFCCTAMLLATFWNVYGFCYGWDIIPIVQQMTVLSS